jgi:hypothetical protein
MDENGSGLESVKEANRVPARDGECRELISRSLSVITALICMKNGVSRNNGM